MILEEDTDFKENEELIHMLLDKTVSKNVNNNTETISFGDKISDKIAETAGSWFFIISFSALIFFWVILNIIILIKPFDAYPFILLNLVLSCIAALQAPVIMMSQNRQEKKDRIRAENDYKVNLKSELIIEDLHEKLDRLIINQEQIMLKLNTVQNKNV
jgi:uncharacterized membrane protein